MAAHRMAEDALPAGINRKICLDQRRQFGGEAGQYEFQDLEEFPGAKAQVFGNKGRAKRSAPACTAPISPCIA